MSKSINKDILINLLKHSIAGSIVSITLTLFLSIFYVVIGEQLSYHLTTDGEVFFLTIVIIVELVLSILFIILFKKTNKYKKQFFIISLIIFDNLLALIVFILPNMIFYNVDFETGILYAMFFIFIFFNLIFLLSHLMYLYVFDKSVYFSKQLSREKNAGYAVLYLFFCFIIYSVIICFIILYIYYLK